MRGDPIEWTRTAISRGYRRAVDASSPAVYVLDNGETTHRYDLDTLPTIAAADTSLFGVLCPTFVARAPADRQIETMSALAAQLRTCLVDRPDVRIAFFVGMQWSAGEESAAFDRLDRIARLVRDDARIVFVGVALPGRGKTRTLNATIRAAVKSNAAGLAWIDDDVYLEDGCLARLLARFIEKGCRGAVGATKIPVAGKTRAARILYTLKNITTPACNYPHACCILVDTRVIARGIPERYASDDGFVCFELLDPTRPNPLEHLELVAAARCWHVVGGPAGQTLRRIRRMLTNHHVFLADYPRPVARYYFRQMLFYGLWPLAPFDASRGVAFGLAKWGLKAVYFCWFARVGGELLVRGIVNRPIREIAWGGYTECIAPIPAPTGQPREARVG
jgi:hypothetical protein